jgi:hypothetical protein
MIRILLTTDQRPRLIETFKTTGDRRLRDRCQAVLMKADVASKHIVNKMIIRASFKHLMETSLRVSLISYNLYRINFSCVITPERPITSQIRMSTIHQILKRTHLIPPRSRKPKEPWNKRDYPAPRAQVPNDLQQMDFVSGIHLSVDVSRHA